MRNKFFRSKFICFLLIRISCAIHLADMPIKNMSKFMEKAEPESVRITTAHCQTKHYSLSFIKTRAVEKRTSDMRQENQRNPTLGECLDEFWTEVIWFL